MLIDCPRCQQTNRLPEGKRARCGKCKHTFTPQELTKARREPKPAFVLEEEEEEEEDLTCDECGRALDEDGLCPKCDDA